MSDDPIQDARNLYSTPYWSAGYFDVSADGHVVARPTRDAADGEIDLVAVCRQFRELGLSTPVLVRFPGILRDRVDSLCGAFDQAMEHLGYSGGYTAVYPIKVNQQRSVVTEIVGHGQGRVGLEAGSKPELMAVLAVTPPGGTIICNGYKDSEYLKLALVGRALGHRVFVVVEKLSELDDLIAASEELSIEPLIGVRVRLASVGAGKWQNTGGEKGKFGLSATQVLAASRRLHEAGLADCLQLLHVHLGSQIANLRDIQNAIHEASRFYVELARLDHPLTVMDVGGGLGVDYEGTRSRSTCSMNYSVDQYALAIVRAMAESCDDADIAHPEIISESGRALTAHHAVLITDVIDTDVVPDEAPAEVADTPMLQDLAALLDNVDTANALETYQEARYWLGEAQRGFDEGRIGLAERAASESLYQAICRRVQGRLSAASRAQRQILDELNEKLADKYFCNFSVFQSLPDVWAFDQIFPILPLDHLERAPDRRALVKDLTCDSDGRVDYYVDRDGIEQTLPLHAWSPDEPYLIGFFMVGAYQETLGDIHNLFGDTDSVNAELDGDGGFHLEAASRGDTADRLLAAVGYEPDALLARYREKLADAGLDGEREENFARMLEDGLAGYTYLED